MKKYFILLLLSFVLVSCNKTETKPITSISKNNKQEISESKNSIVVENNINSWIIREIWSWENIENIENLPKDSNIITKENKLIKKNLTENFSWYILATTWWKWEKVNISFSYSNLYSAEIKDESVILLNSKKDSNDYLQFQILDWTWELWTFCVNKVGVQYLNWVKFDKYFTDDACIPVPWAWKIALTLYSYNFSNWTHLEIEYFWKDNTNLEDILKTLSIEY